MAADLEDVFGDLASEPNPAPALRPAARKAARAYAPPPPRRHRSVSGFGMFALACLCLSLGGWAGSRVQAYAYGNVRQAAAAANPLEMRSVAPPTDYRF